jgi:hypothetical protein
MYILTSYVWCDLERTLMHSCFWLNCILNTLLMYIRLARIFYMNF